MFCYVALDKEDIFDVFTRSLLFTELMSTFYFFLLMFTAPGDNQGVKFLRRFKQLLNPAQVFELSGAGPRLGLRLFRHFAPLRVLVCSGDGSVGWVLQEVDKLDMHVSIPPTTA